MCPPNTPSTFLSSSASAGVFFQFLERHADFPDLLVGTTRARQITIADFEQILRRLHYRQVPDHSSNAPHDHVAHQRQREVDMSGTVRLLFDVLRKPSTDFFTLKELVQFRRRMRISKKAGTLTVADLTKHLLQRYGTMTRAWRRAIDIGAMDAVATKGAVGGKPMSLAGQESGAAAKTRGGIRYREWAAFCHREGHEGNPRTAWEGFGPKNAVLTLRELAYHEYRLLTKFYLEVKSRYDVAEDVWSRVLRVRSEFQVLKRDGFIDTCVRQLLFPADEAAQLFDLLNLDHVNELTYPCFKELFSYWDLGACFDVTGAAQALRVRRKRRHLMDVELREAKEGGGGAVEMKSARSCRTRGDNSSDVEIKVEKEDKKKSKPLSRAQEDRVLALGSQDFVLNLDGDRRKKEFDTFFRFLQKPGRYERIFSLFKGKLRVHKRTFCHLLRQMLYPGDAQVLFYSLFGLRILYQKHVQLAFAEDFREVADRVAPWLEEKGWVRVGQEVRDEGKNAADGGHLMKEEELNTPSISSVSGAGGAADAPSPEDTEESQKSEVSSFAEGSHFAENNIDDKQDDEKSGSSGGKSSTASRAARPAGAEVDESAVTDPNRPPQQTLLADEDVEAGVSPADEQDESFTDGRDAERAMLMELWQRGALTEDVRLKRAVDLRAAFRGAEVDLTGDQDKEVEEDETPPAPFSRLETAGGHLHPAKQEEPMTQLEKLRYHRERAEKHCERAVEEEVGDVRGPGGPPSWLERIGLMSAPEAVILDREGHTHESVDAFWKKAVLGDMERASGGGEAPLSDIPGEACRGDGFSSRGTTGRGGKRGTSATRRTSRADVSGKSRFVTVPAPGGSTSGSKTRRLKITRVRRDEVSGGKKEVPIVSGTPFIPLENTEYDHENWRALLETQTGAKQDPSGLPAHMVIDCHEDPHLLHVRDFLAFPHVTADVRPQSRSDVELELLRRSGSLVRGWFEILDPRRTGAIGLRGFMKGLGRLNVVSGCMRRVYAEFDPLPHGLGLDLRHLDYDSWLLLGFFANCVFSVYPDVDYLLYYAWPRNGTNTIAVPEWLRLVEQVMPDERLVGTITSRAETTAGPGPLLGDNSESDHNRKMKARARRTRLELARKLWGCFVTRGSTRMHVAEVRILKLWERDQMFRALEYPVVMNLESGELELRPTGWERKKEQPPAEEITEEAVAPTTTAPPSAERGALPAEDSSDATIRLVMDDRTRSEYEQALFELEMLDAQHPSSSRHRLLRGRGQEQEQLGQGGGGGVVVEEELQPPQRYAESYSLGEFLDFPVNPATGRARRPFDTGARWSKDSGGASSAGDPSRGSTAAAGEQAGGAGDKRTSNKPKKSVHWIDLDEERRRERTRQKLQAAKNQMFYGRNSVRAHLSGHAGKKKGKAHLLSGSGKEEEEDVAALWAGYSKSAKRQIMGSNFVQVEGNRVVDVADVDNLGDLLDLEPETAE
mmetsp:Transcript_14952/g.37271  ORF Transcript_14952/g.37271 Transcript_14952/m.37271 type:complete len:1460 (+) Transcript_14952:150-4529(+)